MRFIYTFFIALGIVAVLDAQEINKSFTLSNCDLSLNYKSDDVKIDIEIKKIAAGLEIATITLSSQSEFNPAELSIKWAIPSDNIAGYWSSRTYLDKTISSDWAPSSVWSMLAIESPVICLFGFNDVNRQTFAVSEVLNTVISSTAVREEDGLIYNAVRLFTEQHKKCSSYQVQFRLDTRPIPFYNSLAEVANWWTSFESLKPASVPAAARLPMYSSWYSYHQNVTSEALLEECKLAKSIGFESIIVDDGWQTMDSKRGYAYTGDWQPERIPEMKAFVQHVHDLDMKFILWYAVPFVGEKSKSFEAMQGKFLTYWKGQGAYVLDPRFPEVRTFIINTYIKALKEWDLDGFKLDFLERFRSYSDTKLVATDGRDFASINEATDRLMTDLLASLKEIKPEIIIEFRQPYTGPAMRKYGNMLRAGDCPNSTLSNRVETTDLRILSGNTAVHSDMLMWHYQERVEVAALQLLNVLFSVPQMSVRLADIPKEHFEMIRFYTTYWLENRDVLLDGAFIPASPQLNYPVLSAETADKKIAVLYAASSISIDDKTPPKIDIINAKMSREIVLISKQMAGNYKFEIKDCRGTRTDSGKLMLRTGANLFEVPISGMICLEKLK